VSNHPPSDHSSQIAVSSGFKGIALFTPGGDCVYCMDTQKQVHWHVDLCAVLQKHLSLVEPPYFLLPCFTATIDQWFDAEAQQMVTVAEAYPRVLPFQALLNVLFEQTDLQWQPNYTLHTECSKGLIESHRARFPQLWQSHDLILRADRALIGSTAPSAPMSGATPGTGPSSPYLFKLFVRGEDTLATETMLKLLCQTLESYLERSYTLQVIDVAKHPDQAESNHISATPTLVQVFPEPSRRIVGNLTSQKQLAQLLTSQGVLAPYS
jgi:circadian clock protein KaiB